jgi:serine/threonine-protein kinase
MTFMLTAKQRQHLSDAINLSFNKKNKNRISPTQAKSLLKIEYEKLKVEVKKKINPKTKKSQFFLSAWMAKIFDLFKL